MPNDKVQKKSKAQTWHVVLDAASSLPALYHAWFRVCAESRLAGRSQVSVFLDSRLHGNNNL
jgi:hypothetical protein